MAKAIASGLALPNIIDRHLYSYLDNSYLDTNVEMLIAQFKTLMFSFYFEGPVHLCSANVRGGAEADEGSSNCNLVVSRYCFSLSLTCSGFCLIIILYAALFSTYPKLNFVGLWITLTADTSPYFLLFRLTGL